MKPALVVLLRIVLLGAILVYPITWAIALWVPLRHREAMYRDTRADDGLFVSVEHVYQNSALTCVRHDWSKWHLGESAGLTMPREGFIEAGWPLPAIRCDGALDSTLSGRKTGIVFTWPDGFVVPAVLRPRALWEGMRREIPRPLPLRPMFPGVLINAVLYGSLAVSAFQTLGWIRRSIRIRRGQCPRCRYPIGIAASCTECGHRLRLNAPGAGV